MNHIHDINRLITLSRLYPCTPLIDLARCIVDPPPAHPIVPIDPPPAHPIVPPCPPIPDDCPGKPIIRKLYSQVRRRKIPSQDILAVAQSAYVILATANVFTPSAIWIAARRACHEYRVALYGPSKAPEISDRDYHAICCSNPAQPRRAVHEAAKWTKVYAQPVEVDPSISDESSLLIDLTSDLQSSLATILTQKRYSDNHRLNSEFEKIEKYLRETTSRKR